MMSDEYPLEQRLLTEARSFKRLHQNPEIDPAQRTYYYGMCKAFYRALRIVQADRKQRQKKQKI